MKKVSVYVKGDRNSPAYYRIYQYLDNIAKIRCNYRMMMSPSVHNKFMPLSRQPLYVKFFVYLHMVFRVSYYLICDYLCPPDYLVVHRRIITHKMPLFFKLLLKGIMARRARLIWDFDDHILKSKEISRCNFDFMSKYASHIIVTHDFLKSLVLQKYQSKVHILPTSDGDMYKLFLERERN